MNHNIYLFITCLVAFFFHQSAFCQQTDTSPSSNNNTKAYHLPPLSAPGEGAFVSARLLYSLANKPTPECHASSIVETSEGLVCAFFAGTEEGHPDVGIRISRYKDGDWSEAVEVANGIQEGESRYPCWNPVLFVPMGGPLMLFYKVGPNPREWWGMLMTSEDHGHSWSEPRKLGEHEQVGHLLGPVRAKPIQLEDGMLLCPSSTERNVDGEILWKVHMELTEDKGQHWEVIGPLNDGKTFDAIQPTVLRYEDGRMQLLCRTREHVISQSWSEDQGKTWSEMTATSLPNPSAGIDAVSLKDGRQLLVYNHTEKGGKSRSGRHMLNLAISNDGEMWEPVMTLEDDATNEAGYSYPAMIQTSDGMVHITYTYVRESIKHVMIDPSKL